MKRLESIVRFKEDLRITYIYVILRTAFNNSINN